MSEGQELLTADEDWLRSFAASLKILQEWSVGQLTLWAVDDCIGEKSYVACPRRGQHSRLTDCWMCWCDVTFKRANVSQVVAPGAAGCAE